MRVSNLLQENPDSFRRGTSYVKYDVGNSNVSILVISDDKLEDPIYAIGVRKKLCFANSRGLLYSLDCYSYINGHSALRSAAYDVYAKSEAKKFDIEKDVQEKAGEIEAQYITRFLRDPYSYANSSIYEYRIFANHYVLSSYCEERSFYEVENYIKRLITAYNLVCNNFGFPKIDGNWKLDMNEGSYDNMKPVSYYIPSLRKYEDNETWIKNMDAAIEIKMSQKNPFPEYISKRDWMALLDSPDAIAIRNIAREYEKDKREYLGSYYEAYKSRYYKDWVKSMEPRYVDKIYDVLDSRVGMSKSARDRRLSVGESKKNNTLLESPDSFIKNGKEYHYQDDGVIHILRMRGSQVFAMNFDKKLIIVANGKILARAVANYRPGGHYRLAHMFSDIYLNGKLLIQKKYTLEEKENMQIMLGWLKDPQNMSCYSYETIRYRIYTVPKVLSSYASQDHQYISSIAKTLQSIVDNYNAICSEFKLAPINSSWKLDLNEDNYKYMMPINDMLNAPEKQTLKKQKPNTKEYGDTWAVNMDEIMAMKAATKNPAPEIIPNKYWTAIKNTVNARLIKQYVEAYKRNVAMIKSKNPNDKDSIAKAEETLADNIYNVLDSRIGLGLSARDRVLSIGESKASEREKSIEAIGNLGIDFDKEKYTIEDLLDGMDVEKEHDDVTKGNLVMRAKIARAHLEERPDYYIRLKKFVESVFRSNIINEESAEARLYETFYFLSTLVMIMSKNEKLYSYFKAEMEQYPKTKKLMESIPRKFAVFVRNELAPPVITEFDHSLFEFIWQRQRGMIGGAKPPQWYKELFDFVRKTVNVAKIKELDATSSGPKKQVKRMENPALITPENLDKMLHIFYANNSDPDHKEGKKYEPVLSTVDFYTSDKPSKYYNLDGGWLQSYGGPGWGAIAWLLKRLVMYIEGKEKSEDEWQQVVKIVNAISMIQHNSGTVVNKLKNFEDVWLTGINLKTFATSLNDYKYLMPGAELVRQCAAAAIKQYQKFSSEPSSRNNSEWASEYLGDDEPGSIRQKLEEAQQILEKNISIALCQDLKQTTGVKNPYSDETNLNGVKKYVAHLVKLRKVNRYAPNFIWLAKYGIMVGVKFYMSQKDAIPGHIANSTMEELKNLSGWRRDIISLSTWDSVHRALISSYNTLKKVQWND